MDNQTFVYTVGSEDYYDQKLNLESLDNTQRIQCVNVSIFEDDLKEGQENFTLRIVPDTSLPLLTISPAATTIQITDNECEKFKHTRTHTLTLIHKSYPQ